MGRNVITEEEVGVLTNAQSWMGSLAMGHLLCARTAAMES